MNAINRVIVPSATNRRGWDNEYKWSAECPVWWDVVHCWFRFFSIIVWFAVSGTHTFLLLTRSLIKSDFVSNDDYAVTNDIIVIFILTIFATCFTLKSPYAPRTSRRLFPLSPTTGLGP